MAIGFLLIMLGVWVFINGVNGNFSGLLDKSVKFDVLNTGVATGPASAKTVSGGTPLSTIIPDLAAKQSPVVR